MYRQQAEPYEPVARAARIACLVTSHIVHITREHSESHEQESCGRALRDACFEDKDSLWPSSSQNLLAVKYVPATSFLGHQFVFVSEVFTSISVHLFTIQITDEGRKEPRENFSPAQDNIQMC
jgi:hypothetical protein